jgi:peptidylprolyl isomerase
MPPGDGNSPNAGDRVSMHYTGTLLDGTVFDSSRPRGVTFDFVLGTDPVIPGWIEMVMNMKPGEVRKVVIPPYLAYGDQGYGPIEPNSWLIFEMELVSFIPG